MTTSPCILVVGASGGLGASSLALAVGHRTAASGRLAVVVDLDTARGGLDVVAGLEHLPGRRLAALAGVRGAVPPGPLVESLPGEAGCRVLSAGGPGPGPPPDEAVADTVDSLVGSGACVVLDVPSGSPHLSGLLAHAPVVVVLSGLRTRRLADTDALVDRLLALGEAAGGEPDLRLVTRGARPTAGVLDDVVAHLGVVHLHHLPDDPRVVRAAERGTFPGASRDAVRRSADAVLEAADARAGRALGRAS